MSRISVEQRFVAPLAHAWAACTEPARIAGWQADEASGKVEPGGTLVLGWPLLGASVVLDVVVFEPQRLLELRNGEASVRIELSDGVVRLSHSGVEPGDEASGVESSWRLSLAVLAHYLERHWPKPRQVLWFARSAPTTPEAAHVFFTERAALGAWLTKAGEIGPSGTSYALELVSGPKLSGRVLANTPGRDLVLSWEEDFGSTLALRTIPAPSAAAERIVALVWSRWMDRPAPEPLAAAFEASIDRLARLLQNSRSA